MVDPNGPKGHFIPCGDMLTYQVKRKEMGGGSCVN